MVSVLRTRGLFGARRAEALFRGRLPSSARPVPELAVSSRSIAGARRLLCSRSFEMDAECYMFGPYKIDRNEVFYSTPLSFAMVNLRPLVPAQRQILWRIHNKQKFPVNNHVYSNFQVWDVLVCPRRVLKRFADLTAEETSDLWLTAKEVGGRLERYHDASSLTFTIQDGPQAGQTVAHVHIHILPRKKGDFENNDEIYDAIDVKEKELKEKLDLDKERKDRTSDEMTREANEYRVLFS